MSNFNENFLEKWKQEKEAGLRKYYIKNIKGTISIMIGLFTGIIFSKKEIIPEHLLLSFIVVALFPIFSWCANEIRYKKQKK